MSLTETQMLVLSHAANREGGFLLPLPETCRAKGGAVDKVIFGLIRRGWATTIKGRHLREVPADVEPWKTDEDGDPIYPLVTRDGLHAIGVEPETATDEPQGDDGHEVIDDAPEADAEPEPVAASDEPAEATPQEPTRRTSRAAGLARRRLATARNALEAVCSHWADTGRLDEPLVGACRAALAEIGRADVALEAEAPAVPGTPREGTKQARLIEMLRRPEGATIGQIAESTGWQPHTVRGAIAGALKKKLGLTVTSEKTDQGERIYRLG